MLQTTINLNATVSSLQERDFSVFWAGNKDRAEICDEVNKSGKG